MHAHEKMERISAAAVAIAAAATVAVPRANVHAATLIEIHEAKAIGAATRRARTMPVAQVLGVDAELLEHGRPVRADRAMNISGAQHGSPHSFADVRIE